MKDSLKKKNWRKYFEKETMIRIGIPVCIVLLLFSTVQSARFAGIVGRVDQYNEGLVDEVGGFRQDIKSFGDDINEMRSFLLLPTRDYSYMSKEQQEVPDDQQESSETEVALYKFMEGLVTKKTAEENTKLVRARIDGLQKNEGAISGLKALGLIMDKSKDEGESVIFEILAGKEVMFKVQGNLKTGELKISDISDESVLQGTDEKILAQKMTEFVTANAGTIAAAKKTIESNRLAIKDMMGNEEIMNLLVQQGLHLPEVLPESSESISYPILNSEDAVMMTIAIRLKDGALMINDEVIKNAITLKTMLPALISKIDGTTSEEKRALEKKTELETVLKDEAFVSMLSTLGFKINMEPRSESNKFLYDVTDATGKLQFSFVIEMSSGMVKILKDNKETDILSAVGENAKKKL